jgi:hypothetical protein
MDTLETYHTRSTRALMREFPCLRHEELHQRTRRVLSIYRASTR